MPSVFGYWTLRGLGQASRLMLEYSGEKYEDVRYNTATDKDKWFNEKAKNPHNLAFPNLPYYVDGDIKMTQSTAILRHLARKHGLAGNSEDETRQLDILEGVTGDLRMWFGYLCYGTEETFKKMLPEFKERAVACCKQLSGYLGSNQWLLGDRISYVDFLLYDLLSNWLELEPTLLDETPNLQQLRARFEALPAIQAYMKSDRFIKWPLNGPQAYFGGK